MYIKKIVFTGSTYPYYIKVVLNVKSIELHLLTFTIIIYI